MLLLLCVVVGVYIYHTHQRSVKKNRMQTYTGAGCFGSKLANSDTESESSGTDSDATAQYTSAQGLANETLFNLVHELLDVTWSETRQKWIKRTPFECTAAGIATRVGTYRDTCVRKLIQQRNIRANIIDFKTTYQSPYKNDIIPYRWDSYTEYTHPLYIVVIPDTTETARESAIPVIYPVGDGIVLNYTCLGYNTPDNILVRLCNKVCEPLTQPRPTQPLIQPNCKLLLYKRILDMPQPHHAGDTSTEDVASGVNGMDDDAESVDDESHDSPKYIRHLNAKIAELHTWAPVWDQTECTDIALAKQTYSKLYRYACVKFHLRAHTAWHKFNILYLKWQTCWLHHTCKNIREYPVVLNADRVDIKPHIDKKSEFDADILAYKAKYIADTSKADIRKKDINALYKHLTDIEERVRQYSQDASAAANTTLSALYNIPILKYDICTHIKTNTIIQLYENSMPAVTIPGYTFMCGNAEDMKTTDDADAYIAYLASVNYTDAANLKISKRLIADFPRECFLDISAEI